MAWRLRRRLKLVVRCYVCAFQEPAILTCAVCDRTNLRTRPDMESTNARPLFFLKYCRMKYHADVLGSIIFPHPRALSAQAIVIAGKDKGPPLKLDLNITSEDLEKKLRECLASRGRKATDPKVMTVTSITTYVHCISTFIDLSINWTEYPLAGRICFSGMGFRRSLIFHGWSIGFV